ncbi:MAG: hypothetical protein ACPG6B_00620 [Oceanihabitans sp.]
MKLLNTVCKLFCVFLAVNSTTQCSSSKKTNNLETTTSQIELQEKTSLNLGEVYYQHWVAGVQGGGSGVTLFVTVTENKEQLKLDSVYFSGMQAKLNPSQKNYVANFKTEANKKEDLVMSNEEKAEYGNQIPNNKNFPFKLENNQCVISYVQNNTTKYFKVSNLIKKPRQEFPGTAPNR